MLTPVTLAAEETLTLCAFSLMDLIIPSPTLSLPPIPHLYHAAWGPHLTTLFLPPFLSSPFPSTPALGPISSGPCHCLLGYKVWKLVDPIDKSLLTWYPAKESPSQVTLYCNPIKMSRVQRTWKNCGPLDNNGSIWLQGSLGWNHNTWVATNSTHGYNWPVSNLTKTIKNNYLHYFLNPY